MSLQCSFSTNHCIHLWLQFALYNLYWWSKLIGKSCRLWILQTTVSSLPFGGVGESGMGSYHGKFSFDAFSHKKAVLYRSFNGDSTTRYPPYTAEKQKLLRALFNGNIFGLLLALIGWSRDWEDKRTFKSLKSFSCRYIQSELWEICKGRMSSTINCKATSGPVTNC